MTAASEGNIVAMRVLIEHGADLTVQDRWGNTAESDARGSKAGLVLEYLQSLKDSKEGKEEKSSDGFDDFPTIGTEASEKEPER